jgi:SAM-dependent methyltransferase
MPRLAAARIPPSVVLWRASIARPFEFLADTSIDLAISPLVLDSIKDWRPVMRELARVLVPDGLLVFSVGHPMADFALSPTHRYFDVELTMGEWSSYGVVVPRVPPPVQRDLRAAPRGRLRRRARARSGANRRVSHAVPRGVSQAHDAAVVPARARPPSLSTRRAAARRRGGRELGHRAFEAAVGGAEPGQHGARIVAAVVSSRRAYWSGASTLRSQWVSGSAMMPASRL